MKIREEQRKREKEREREGRTGKLGENIGERAVVWAFITLLSENINNLVFLISLKIMNGFVCVCVCVCSV